MKTSVGGAQAMRYAGSHNVARPDRPGCYALSASPKGYQIGWSDPSGIDISAMIAWDYEKGDLLLRYVYSLYIPPACAMSWTQLSLWPIEPPMILLCGISNSKANLTRTVGLFLSEQDQFQHAGHRFQESELYCKLQGAAGWVTFVDSCDVGFTTGSDSDASARVKKRLLMSSGGEALDKVPTIKMFLMSV